MHLQFVDNNTLLPAVHTPRHHESSAERESELGVLVLLCLVSRLASATRFVSGFSCMSQRTRGQSRGDHESTRFVLVHSPIFVVVLFVMCDWSNEFTLKFLKLYQNEPVIWDPIHSHHKDRKQINDAWVRLSGQVECSVTELKKKKDSLMATFRGHLRKKKASIRSGAGVNDIYKPIWFAYKYMESFLAPVNECQTTTNTQDKSFVTDEQSQREEISSVYVEKNQSVVTENITENTSTVVPEKSIATPSRPTPTIRRRGTTPELQGAGIQMKEAFSMLKNVITKRTSDKEDDEYDLFGKMLVKKIRKLPEYEREVFMYEVEGLFLKKLRNVNAAHLNTSSTKILDSPFTTFSTSSYQSRPSSTLSSYSESNTSDLSTKL